MELEYSYEVIAVGANSMDVRFTILGGSTVIVGCRLPPVGVAIGDHLIQYAPIQLWEDELTERQTIEVGATGTTVVTTIPVPPEELVLTPESL